MSADIAETIKRVRELSEAALPGPWRAGAVWRDCVMVSHPVGLAGPGGERVLLRMNQHFPHTDDAALIAYYRTAAPILADECERLAALFQQTHGVHHGWIAECQRLRERLSCARCGADSSTLDAKHHCSTCYAEAQATITRLRERVRVLEEALREIAGYELRIYGDSVAHEMRDAARAALEGK